MCLRVPACVSVHECADAAPMAWGVWDGPEIPAKVCVCEFVGRISEGALSAGKVGAPLEGPWVLRRAAAAAAASEGKIAAPTPRSASLSDRVLLVVQVSLARMGCLDPLARL